MQLPTFSFAFADWIAQRVHATGGALVEGVVYDARHKDFAKLVRSAIDSGVKYCIGISLASAERVQSETPDDTLHEVTCELCLIRSALCHKLSVSEAANLAEALYLSFSAAHWRSTPGSQRPDVSADSYRADLRPGDGLLTISFNISTTLNLDINNP